MEWRNLESIYQLEMRKRSISRCTLLSFIWVLKYVQSRKYNTYKKYYTNLFVASHHRVCGLVPCKWTLLVLCEGVISVGSVWRTNTKSLTEFPKTACSISQFVITSGLLLYLLSWEKQAYLLLHYYHFCFCKYLKMHAQPSIFGIWHHLLSQPNIWKVSLYRHHHQPTSHCRFGKLKYRKKFCEMILNSAIKSRARSETCCYYVCMLSRKKFHLTKMKVWEWKTSVFFPM